jgi:hypothetical protein
MVQHVPKGCATDIRARLVIISLKQQFTSHADTQVPGSYILYTHMMSQRRRVLKGKGKRA